MGKVKIMDNFQYKPFSYSGIDKHPTFDIFLDRECRVSMFIEFGSVVSSYNVTWMKSFHYVTFYYSNSFMQLFTRAAYLIIVQCSRSEFAVKIFNVNISSLNEFLQILLRSFPITVLFQNSFIYSVAWNMFLKWNWLQW